MIQESILSLREIAFSLYKHRWKMLTIFLATLIGAQLYLVFKTPIYVAETKVLIKIGKEKFSAIDSQNTAGYNVLFQERGQNINNEIEIIRDPSLTIGVYEGLKEWLLAHQSQPKTLWQKAKAGARSSLRFVKRIIVDQPMYWLGLKDRLTEDQAMVGAFLASLRVEFVEDTDILKLGFAWPNPEFAAFAVNRYADTFIRQHIQVHEGRDSMTFYQEQLGLWKNNLAEKTAELDRLRSEKEIASLDMQKQLAVEEVTQLSQAISEKLRAFEANSIQRNLTRKAFTDSDDWLATPDVGTQMNALSILDEHYYDLLKDKTKLLTAYSVDSRDVQNIQEEIAALREQKASSLINFFQLRMNTIQHEISVLRTQMATKEARMQELISLEARLAQLERERALAESNYVIYATKVEDLRLSEGLDEEQISSVRIVSPAYPPISPSYPDKMLILSIAAALGVFLALGFVTLAEFFDQTFRNAAEVREVLDVRVLGSLIDSGRSLPSGAS